MRHLKYGMSTFAMFFIGFLTAFIGVTKYDHAEAAEESLKESIAFGDSRSNIEVYIFTDWACPACRKLEPEIEQMAPKVMRESKLFFVDHAIHPETMNFIPYNLSFMINNKDHYLKLREALTTLSTTTAEPDDEEIEVIARSVGDVYEQLNYAEVAVGIKYFKELSEKFKIRGTPTVVVINTESKKGRKLAGNGEISETNILQAIESLKSM